jgi:ankyrin repeat protein
VTSKPNASDRCDEANRIRNIDAAFRAGDLSALRAAVEDPSVIPNGPMPLAVGECLTYAVYHSPLSFIRTLLEHGADPNPREHSGFPPLVAALTCHRPRPGGPSRADVRQIVELLIAFGADPNQRGINDETPLHAAAAKGDLELAGILLAAGGDPTLRTRIDDGLSPIDVARRARFDALVSLFESART